MSVDYEDILVSLETSKLAKQKGFDFVCPHWFGVDSGKNKEFDLRLDYPYKDIGIKKSQQGTETYERPTFGMLSKWLRSKGIFVYINFDDLTINIINYLTHVDQHVAKCDLIEYEDFEDLLQEGLKLLPDLA